MNKSVIKDAQLTLDETKKHLSAFQGLMMSILERRGVFLSFEDALCAQDLLESQVEEDLFARHYSTDYGRAQLTDIRKFFDSDSRAYQLMAVVQTLFSDSPEIQESAKKLYEAWNKETTQGVSLSEIADKMVMHYEKNVKLRLTDRNALDSLIDALDAFLDQVLDQDQMPVKFRQRHEYLKDVRKDTLNHFIKLIS